MKNYNLLIIINNKANAVFTLFLVCCIFEIQKQILYKMKKILLLLLVIFISFGTVAQKKKKFKGLRLGEKIGKLTSKLLTSKTDNLSEVSLRPTIISGVYNLDSNTSESKYFPKGTVEGDYIVSITFMKNEGVGLLELEGTVLCDGEEMEYIGAGSYVAVFNKPFTELKTIDVSTSSGGKAKFTLIPLAPIDIISVNGDEYLPIVDLDKDITLEYDANTSNPNALLKVSMVTKVAGAVAFNKFADFSPGNGEVTIPKEALSNTEISGSTKNAGNFEKGENFFMLEKEIITEREDLDESQNVSEFGTLSLYAKAYASIPVIVRGKQEDKIISAIRIAGETENKVGFDLHKPNANTGIPFSRGSKFGLASLTLNVKPYKVEKETSENSWSVGNTKYTQTTTVTTTFEFPQLANEHWDYLLENFYQEVVKIFKEDYDIEFVSVEDVTSTTDYNTFFVDETVNTQVKVNRTYKNTNRSNPKGLGEIFGNLSSNLTNDTPLLRIMKEADIDGLVNIDIDLQVGKGEDDYTVLIPNISISIRGRDEQKSNKQATYVEGMLVSKTGNPFNSEIVKADKKALLNACSHHEMVEALKIALAAMRAKEIEMGFDKIWNIGE